MHGRSSADAQANCNILQDYCQCKLYSCIVWIQCKFIIYVCLFDNVPRGRLVSILSRVTGWRVRGSNTGKGKIRPSFRKSSHRLWGPRTPLFVGYQGSLPGVKRLGRELNQSSPLSIDVMNEWSYTSTALVWTSWCAHGEKKLTSYVSCIV